MPAQFNGWFYQWLVIWPIEIEDERININDVTRGGTHYGVSLRGRKMNHRKDQILRNLVNPELGLYILEQAQGIIRQEKTNQIKLFNDDAA